MRRTFPNCIRAMTLIESLVASIVVAVCIMGVVSLWGFTMKMTSNTDDRAVGYNLVRRALERAKSQGFNGAPEGSVVLYYDAAGGGESVTSGSLKFSVTTVVTSSLFETQNGVVRPADNAIRTVVATVRTVSDNAIVQASGTLLVRGGL